MYQYIGVDKFCFSQKFEIQILIKCQRRQLRIFTLTNVPQDFSIEYATTCHVEK